MKINKILYLYANRHVFQHKGQLVDLTPTSIEWIKKYSALQGKSLSLIIECLIRSLALNKPVDEILDKDLIQSLDLNMELIDKNRKIYEDEIIL